MYPPPGKHLSRIRLSIHRRQLFVATAAAPSLPTRENEMVRRGYIKRKGAHEGNSSSEQHAVMTKRGRIEKWQQDSMTKLLA